jgi:dihydroorotate dehydrogenase (fumarate)
MKRFWQRPGIHTAQDVLKMLMAGASITMLCPVLLSQGIGQIRVLKPGGARQMQGSMSQKR